MTEQDDRQRIIDKASEKFLESGITKVTLDEVASELGISKKTVYKFFPSKDVLLQTIVRMMLGHVEREVTAIVHSEDPFERKLTSLLTLIGRLIRRIGKQFQLDLQRMAPDLWIEIDTFRKERVLIQVKQMFDQAKRENIFRSDLNIDLFYLTFISTVQGVINPKTLAENSFSAEEAFRGIIRILFEGALTNDARQRIHYFDVNQKQ
jgi:AcrR family transcriptional regulator